MSEQCWRRTVFLLAGAVVLMHSGSGLARQTIVNGTIGVGYDYWERTYDNENAAFLLLNPDEGDSREWSLRPEIELNSLGEHDSVVLRYAPVLVYEELLASTDVDHYLALDAERLFVKNWKATLSEDFVLTNDSRRYGTTFYPTAPAAEGGGAAPPPAGGQPSDEITQNVGRSRYWTNNLVLETTYTYGEERDLGVGYGYRVLRNESDENRDPGYDEYDRHDLFGSWSSRWSQSWRTDVGGNYIQGRFDEREIALAPGTPMQVSQDLEEYHADLGLAYARTSNDAFPLAYRYRGTDYEGLRRDIWAHELAPGWEHAFDANTRLAVAAGPSYVDADELDGEWAYTATVRFSKVFQHGEFSLLLDKRLEPRNFTGGDDSGMTDLAQAGLDVTYRFTQVLSATLFAQYREEDILDPQGEYYLAALDGRQPLTEESVGDVTYSRDSISAGASMNYGFWRWFVASLRYIYYQQDGDLDSDSFTDHRVMVQLSASKELWR